MRGNTLLFQEEGENPEIRGPTPNQKEQKDENKHLSFQLGRNAD